MNEKDLKKEGRMT